MFHLAFTMMRASFWSRIVQARQPVSLWIPYVERSLELELKVIALTLSSRTRKLRRELRNLIANSVQCIQSHWCILKTANYKLAIFPVQVFKFYSCRTHAHTHYLMYSNLEYAPVRCSTAIPTLHHKNASNNKLVNYKNKTHVYIVLIQFVINYKLHLHNVYM